MLLKHEITIFKSKFAKIYKNFEVFRSKFDEKYMVRPARGYQIPRYMVQPANRGVKTFRYMVDPAREFPLILLWLVLGSSDRNIHGQHRWEKGTVLRKGPDVSQSPGQVHAM